MRPLLLALALLPALAHAEAPSRLRPQVLQSERALVCVDIGAVASRYIGETEKTLNRAFDVAARSETSLTFDEADALFGKRTDVKDAHDRYANQETAYLLRHAGRVVRLDGFPRRALLVDDGDGRLLIVLEAAQGVTTLDYARAGRAHAIAHARRVAAQCGG